MAELFRQIKRSVAELFRQIKRSVAEQFRQIKRSVAEPHMEISFWFGKGDIPNEKITVTPCYVSFGATVPPRYVLFGGTVLPNSFFHKLISFYLTDLIIY